MPKVVSIQELDQIVSFTSVRLPEERGYQQAAQRMLALAETQPGFLGFESARNEIGISVSYWQSLEAIKAWKEHPEHRATQSNAKHCKALVCKLSGTGLSHRT